MSNPADIRILEARCTFENLPFRTPLKFGGRVMDSTDLINVEVDVERRDGRHATGFGSMPVGNIWAWPSPDVAPDQSTAAMKQLAEQTAELAESYPEFDHPLDTIYRLSAEYAHMAGKIVQKLSIAGEFPELAQLVAASPLDAAVHDAYGRAADLNSYDMLSDEFMNYDLTEYLDDQFEGEYLDQYTLREPKPTMPLYHLVGALDPLTSADVADPVGDGLPETLGEWVAADGLTHLKIKLGGDDLDWDVGRVAAIDQVTAEAQAARGCTEWHYSLDFNEKCENEQYLLDFLAKIREKRAEAWDRVQYIEQPTHRDLKSHPDNTMHEAAKLKPVVIDESLVDYDSLLLSREQGYSGVALKACKGHTEALLMAAAAQKMGLFLCVQDLTCPGFSFLHSASLAARIPGIAAIEGNGRQYCPSGNKRWAKQFPGMFDITDGSVATAELDGIGLGF